MSDRVTSPEADADRKIPDVLPEPHGGDTYDPRPLEDKARRRIAYSLIGLFAIVVLVLQAMVIFNAITVDEIKDFGVIVGPLVALVSAATGFYYGTKN